MSSIQRVLEQNITIPTVQRHRGSGQVWRVIAKGDRRFPPPATVRVERKGTQRVLWLAYWLDGEAWEAV